MEKGDPCCPEILVKRGGETPAGGGKLPESLDSAPAGGEALAPWRPGGGGKAPRNPAPGKEGGEAADPCVRALSSVDLPGLRKALGWMCREVSRIAPGVARRGLWDHRGLDGVRVLARLPALETGRRGALEKCWRRLRSTPWHRFSAAARAAGAAGWRGAGLGSGVSPCCLTQTQALGQNGGGLHNTPQAGNWEHTDTTVCFTKIAPDVPGNFLHRK